MRQIQKPALVQNETNAKATNNNFTQKSRKSQKGESQAIHRRQIIILSPAEIAEITEMLRTPQYLQSK